MRDHTVEQSRLQVEQFMQSWDRQSPAPRLILPDQLPRPKWVINDSTMSYDQRQTRSTRHLMNQNIVAQSVGLLQQWLQLRHLAQVDYIHSHIDNTHWQHILED